MAFERVPDLLIVFGGTLDDPDRSAVDRHVLTRSAVKWMTFPLGVRPRGKHRLD